MAEVKDSKWVILAGIIIVALLGAVIFNSRVLGRKLDKDKYYEAQIATQEKLGDMKSDITGIKEGIEWIKGKL